MKTNGLTQFIASFLVAILISFSADVKAVTIEVNDIAPNITLPNQAQQNVSLSAFKGKLVLVYFWVSWDPNSRVNNPNVGILHKKYENAQFRNASGFELLAVSLDSEKDQWLKAIREDNLSGNHLNDFYSKYAAAYQIEKLPASFLVDEKGMVVGKDMTLPALDKYLGERAITYGIPQQQGVVMNTTPTKQPPILAPSTTSNPPIATNPTAKTGTQPIQVKKEGTKNIIAPSPIEVTVDNANYKIQVGAYKTVAIQKFKNIMLYGNLSTEKNATGINRVLLGDFTEADQALHTLGEVQKQGYPDAFLVLYKGMDRQRIVGKEELAQQQNELTPVVAKSVSTAEEVDKILDSPTNVANESRPKVHVPISVLSTKIPNAKKITPTSSKQEPEAREQLLYDSPATVNNYATPTTHNYPYAAKKSAPTSLVPQNIIAFESVTPANQVYYDAPANHTATWYPPNNNDTYTYTQPANNNDTYTYTQPANNNDTYPYTQPATNTSNYPYAASQPQPRQYTYTGSTTTKQPANSQQRVILNAPSYASNPAASKNNAQRQQSTVPRTQVNRSKTYKRPTNVRRPANSTRTAGVKKPSTKANQGAKDNVDRNLSQMLDAYLEGYDYNTIGEDSSDRLRAKQKRLKKKRNKMKKKRAKAKAKKRKRSLFRR